MIKYYFLLYNYLILFCLVQTQKRNNISYECVEELVGEETSNHQYELPRN